MAFLDERDYLDFLLDKFEGDQQTFKIQFN